MAPASDTEQSRPGGRDRPLAVSQVVRGTTRVLERHIGTIWVEGETSSVSRPSSGHLYFTLKDRRSQLRAVMWRSDASRLKFEMEDGLAIRCRGRLGIYERDGKFQLYVQVAEPAGLGSDALALEQLRAKLAEEGLFNQDRKRPLPALPTRIGVVTSRTGAAVRDVIRAVQRRFPVPILVVPAVVQGGDAPRTIVRALQAVARTDVDVVIVGRGGGSASDLSAFNDERVVRAVAACPVPTVSAVGHEVDISLTDLVADRRAATPTMAGEMVVPVRAELAAILDKEVRRLNREIALYIADSRQELDQLLASGQRSLGLAFSDGRRRVAELATRLEARHPRAQLAAHRGELRELEARAAGVAHRRVDAARQSLSGLVGRLDALSPLRVLQRGYAIAAAGEHVLTSSAQASAGDQVTIRLREGSLDCTVDQVNDETRAHPDAR